MGSQYFRLREVKWVSLAEALFAGALFGTASIFIRFLPMLDAPTIGFYRLMIAAILLMVMNYVLFKPRSSEFLSHLKHSIPLGILLGLHFIFFISAVKETTVMNATILVNTTPIFATIVGLAFFGIRPAFAALVGLPISFAGTFLIALSTASLIPGNLRGDLEALAAAFLWALYLNLGRPLRKKVPLLVVMPFIYIVAAGVMFLVVCISGNRLYVPTFFEFMVLVALALLPTALGHTLHFSSLKRLTPFQAATTALLEPIVASSLAALLFSEVPHQIFVVGAITTLVGIFLVSKEAKS
ncbi:MAG: DMT family transporter [Nitrososphaerota archaeon]|nr:DMT family transporter [Aigarchaeota archaeon]MDW8076160.1 DMT family transporter [Nitrososphaerota archaeon]